MKIALAADHRGYDMNVLYLGGRVMGIEVAWDHSQAFVSARFSGAERHVRRLGKVARLEC